MIQANIFHATMKANYSLQEDQLGREDLMNCRCLARIFGLFMRINDIYKLNLKLFDFEYIGTVDV